MAVPGGRDQDISGELLRGLRAGSSQAWARLYDRLAPGIRRFASSSLSDEETAEDVVVETLAHAAQGITRFDPQKSSLTAWIYGIARHRVLAGLRWCGRRKSIPAWAQVSFDDLSELADSHDLGERTAARLDAQRRIEEVTGLLSDRETELLSLSAIDELPFRETGRVVGCSEQAAHMALHRARQKVRRIAIEGRLVLGARRRAAGGFYPSSHVFSGTEDRLVGAEFGCECDLSPVSDDIAYHLREPGVQHYWPMSGHIWKAKRDGSGAVNLTEAAGLRGINCHPTWSPDGTMIAFVHWDEPGGWFAGPGETWVGKADGSEARRVAPKETVPVEGCSWSPHGLCLFCDEGVAVAGAVPASVDLWGRHVRLIPSVMDTPESSPDGTRVAWERAERGHVEGDHGYWRQLLVTEADGSRPRILVEQFIPDAQLGAYRPAQEWTDAGPAYGWRDNVMWWAGPHVPAWSPRGDKIAFLAALPFDPEQMTYHAQVDAWVYDLVTRRLTKITNTPTMQDSLSWR